MPLNSTVATLLARAAAAGRPAISAGTPADARALMTAGRAALGGGPDLPRVEDVSIRTRSGDLAARLYSPCPEPDGLVVYLHGGGWVVGALDDFDAVARVLAQRSRCAFLLPDYRLAPETPFPGALEDVLDSLAWAGERLSDLAGAGRPLIVAGDSAGANLATVAAAERRGGPKLARQVLIYPVVDCDLDTASYRDPAHAGMVSRKDMLWFFDHYVDAARRADPRVSPLRRPSLADLPPTHVAVAEYDVLRDEGEAYARRLAADGVPTTLTRHAGLPHGFIRLHNLVPEADEAVTAIADAIAGRPVGVPVGRETLRDREAAA